ncbi:MAG: Nucleotide-binding protein UspA family [Candidatus Methanohalarchaeum thermophilum]|uniref:Nucleotide-binding protein UspA family n=1 Tax=Methanohalarchaeum thermophilum TaxID=1903181 RepID=A0A1Q6DVP1_METT1|nr:MAG: Nucleotide-binding protein UspA family [Candidatus Methanohalarchaeum thermophilum]
MGITFIAFEGYEIIVQSGEEVVKPRKSVPKAVFYSMIAVVSIYMLVSIVLMGAVEVTPVLIEAASSHAQIPEDPALWQVLGNLGELGLARAANQILPMGTLVILVAGIFSTLSALNATTFSSTRVGFVMGRDNVLPELFKRVHPEKKTPHLSVLFSGMLIILMAISLPIEDVAVATDIMFLLLFLQVNFAVIKIRREYGHKLDYGYVMPYFPYVPIIGILTNLFLALYLFTYSPLAWIGAISWILFGMLIFFLYSRKNLRKEEIKEETKLVSEERVAKEKEYQVLIPISNPENLKKLAKIGGKVAKEKNGEILFTTIVTIPEQTPIDEAHKYTTEEQRELLEKASEYVEADVPVHTVVTVGRDISKSINNIAYSRDSDLILLGWRGKRKRVPDLVLGSTIDNVVKNAPCDVAVAKTKESKREKILVPVAKGKNSELAEEISMAFGETGEITLLNVTKSPNGESEELISKHKKKFEKEDIDVETEIISGEDIGNSIISYAKENSFDTIVIGATKKGIVQQALFGTIPEKVGEEFDGEVIMVKKRQPLQSVIRRISDFISDKVRSS